MKTTLKPHACGWFLSLLLLCSCAEMPDPSAITPASELPAEVAFNQDAGRGNLLIVVLRLESGEELPFAVDTGTGFTCFDDSLAPKLGKPVGTTTIQMWGKVEKKHSYATPRLYLGGTRLMTGDRVITLNLKQLPSLPGRPLMGILGMDMLGNYCLQLDFATAKMRFLDGAKADKQAWGKAFPIVALNATDPRPAVGENLCGAQGPHSLIDSGYFQADGWLMPKYHRQWTNQTVLPEKGRTRSPDGMFGGETYPQTALKVEDVESDGIGLLFLARHLVTLDFPRQTLYLKRTSSGPLAGSDALAAVNYLKDLQAKGQMPGWSKDERGTLKAATMGTAGNSATIEVLKNGTSSTYHYEVTRASPDAPWKLQKAWRTEQGEHSVEQYPVP